MSSDEEAEIVGDGSSENAAAYYNTYYIQKCLDVSVPFEVYSKLNILNPIMQSLRDVTSLMFRN